MYDIDELEPMQEILSRYFGTIRDLFRYYAAMYHTDNKLLLFPKSAWLKFCQEMRFMDEDQLTTKELSKLYGRCGGIPRDESFQRNTTANEEARDRIQGLMRYEFLELIVRTALKKYNAKTSTRKVEIDLLSPSEAIRTFLDNDLLPNAFTTDHVGQFPGPSFFRNPTTLGICECITRKLIQFYVQIKIIFVKYLIFMLVATAHFRLQLRMI